MRAFAARGLALCLVVGGLLAALYLPPLQGVFRFAPLDARLLGIAALAGPAGIAWSELIKAATRWRERRH